MWARCGGMLHRLCRYLTWLLRVRFLSLADPQAILYASDSRRRFGLVTVPLFSSRVVLIEYCFTAVLCVWCDRFLCSRHLACWVPRPTYISFTLSLRRYMYRVNACCVVRYLECARLPCVYLHTKKRVPVVLTTRDACCQDEHGHNWLSNRYILATLNSCTVQLANMRCSAVPREV